MKIICLTVLLFVYVSLTQAEESTDHESQQWQMFKTKYVKGYKHVDEEKKRKDIFLENLKFIRNHNRKHRNGEETHEVAVNAFADLTNEEFVGLMTGLRRSKNQTRRGRPFKIDNPGILDPAVDWRDKGAVTPVKNQWICGSCWAFSATGALEGQHFLKNGELISLSEQNLVDCSRKEGNDGCNGGYMEYAFQYVVDNKGIDSEQSYPYSGWDRRCRFNASSIGATAVDYVDLPTGSEYDLQVAVNQIGPIAAGMHASDLSFQFYLRGVYKSKKCSKTDLDHGVLVVGYGVDWLGGDYWLVKNSWGTWWGQKGYFWLARNQDNTCGIATQASYPVV